MSRVAFDFVFRGDRLCRPEFHGPGRNAHALVDDEGSLFFSAVVKDEDGRPVQPPESNGAPGRLRLYKGHFEDHVGFDRERHDRDWREKRKLTEATFGWAITAHKAQGSQWENVIVWDDGLGKSDLDRRRWLYTAITRAERGLVILA